MQLCNQQEIQKRINKYTIDILYGDTVELPYITEENIRENKDDTTDIELSLATYNHRLYKAFKEKELVVRISKEVENVTVRNANEIIHREFEYCNYFKIVSFDTHADNDSVPYYVVTFQSI